MLSSNTLQAPATGRSRYSKALPSVPALKTDFSSELSPPPVPNKTAIPPRKELPRPPPATKDSSAQAAAPDYKPHTPPMSSVASTVSSTTTPLSTKPLPPTMGIPRKAVGSGPPKTPALETAKPVLVSPPLMGGAFKVDVPGAPSTTATGASAPYELPVLPMKSPSESLSSILSAYSRSSYESPVNASEGHTSSQYSEQILSPSQLAPTSSKSSTSSAVTPAPPPKETSSAVPADLSSPPMVPPKSTSPTTQESLPPPPPFKDVVSQPKGLPASPRSQQPNSDMASPAPPRPQLWRRRSGSLSKDLPDLKLTISHGSTAASTPQVPPKEGSETASIKTHSTAETVKPAPPPKSKPLPPIGLPGRNIRPAGNKSDENAEDKMSKPQELTEGGKTEGARPAAARPPTPEYQKQDVRTPVLDYFIPPESPASSPDLSQETGAGAAKIVSGAADAQPVRTTPVLKLDTKGSVTRKAVGSAKTPAQGQGLANPQVPQADLQPARSAPDLRSQAPSPSSMPMPSFPSAGSSIGSPRGRSPSAFSARGRDASQTRGAPRGSSVRPDGSRTPLYQRDPRYSAPERDDPRLVRSNSRGMCYRGRDGTLYPEMKELPEPDEKAAHFPSHPEGPIAGGTVLPAPPIRNTHYLCYQKHRTMGRRSNRQNPLACQTCEKADAEDRWACSFCQLRICQDCYESFNLKQRDLQVLINSLKAPDVGEGLSLPSERAGSGLGLDIDFS